MSTAIKPPATLVEEMLSAAGISRYQSCHCGNTSEAAERQLAGRSHYYDASTRRYFGARVLDMHTDAAGAFLLTVESVTPPSGPRLFRFVAFDCFGNVLHRTTKETNGFSGHRTADAARKERREWLLALDAVACLRKALVDKAASLDIEAAKYRAAAAAR